MIVPSRREFLYQVKPTLYCDGAQILKECVVHFGNRCEESTKADLLSAYNTK